MKSPTLYPLLLALGTLHAAAGTTAYNHGDPSADEQFMLELINRARADPAAEGIFLATVDEPRVQFAITFFGVNLARLQADFAGYPSRPPLAFNPKLLASSHRHSKDMAENNFQDHNGTDDSTISTRVADAGYSAISVSENIYSNLVSSPLLAHAGFNIDWGSDAGGVQDGVGHRQAIMGFGTVDYREIGIGIVARSGPDVATFGKLSVTQDFGTRVASPYFLVGVAYYDVNGNSICDPGEGIPGIRVQPASGSFHAVTSASGGYAIPFSTAPGTSSVTFSGGGLEAPEGGDFIINGGNAKEDLRITSGDPFVILETLDRSAGEKGGASAGSASFRISRVGPKSEALKVVLTGPTTGKRGKASAGDFTLSTTFPATVVKDKSRPGKFTVTLPARQSSAEIKLTPVADQETEPTEIARFAIGKSTAYRTGNPGSAVISIKP